MIFTKISKNKYVYRFFLLFFWLIIYTIRKLIVKEKVGSNRIIVISLQRIGDSVFSLDAINSILKFHNNKITLFCYPGSSDIFSLAFPGIDLIILKPEDFSINKRIAKSNIRKVIKNIHPVRIYDLSGSITTVSMLLTARCNEIIGTNLEFYKKIYTKYIPIRKEPHISDIYTDVIKDIMPIEVFKMLSLSDRSDGYILVHPFAGWDAKEWGLNKFIELTSSLNKFRKSYLLAAENSFPDGIIRDIKNKNIETIITSNTGKLIEAINGCSFFIGNDSGPIQIANLLGKPSFTIYGPTNPEFHKPLKGENRFIIKKLSCSSKPGEKWCSTYGGMIGCPSYECMKQLSYQEVEKAIIDYLVELKLITK